MYLNSTACFTPKPATPMARVSDKVGARFLIGVKSQMQALWIRIGVRVTVKGNIRVRFGYISRRWLHTWLGPQSQSSMGPTYLLTSILFKWVLYLLWKYFVWEKTVSNMCYGAAELPKNPDISKRPPACLALPVVSYIYGHVNKLTITCRPHELLTGTLHELLEPHETFHSLKSE